MFEDVSSRINMIRIWAAVNIFFVSKFGVCISYSVNRWSTIIWMAVDIFSDVQHKRKATKCVKVHAPILLDPLKDSFVQSTWREELGTGAPVACPIQATIVFDLIHRELFVLLL